jgi:hypothetical protein
MTQQEIFGRTAAWVTPGPCCPYPLIRKEFDLPKLRKATITITGLGNFFLFLNGRRVSDDLFLPLYTDYEPCTRMTDLPFANVHIDRIEREQLNHRVLCLEWDVTDYLSAGKNCIGIRLAQMWYVNYSDELKCCFRLSYEAEDGTTGEIVSDESLLFHGSEIVDGDLWHGESFDFRGEDEYAWINENCYKYGFIVRYDSEKTDITGIAYEPWHFRYLGLPHSEIISGTRLCYEEYMSYLKAYPYDGDHMMFTSETGDKYEIFYIRSAGETTSFELPEGTEYFVSGNNIDGYIVTLKLGK